MFKRESREKILSALKMFIDVALQKDFSKKHDALQTQPEADEAKPIDPKMAKADK